MITVPRGDVGGVCDAQYAHVRIVQYNRSVEVCTLK